MKTDIITFHFVNNFGGALQAYALQRAVEENCNSEVEIIDYRNSFITFTDAVRLFPITGKTGEISSGIKTMGERLGRVDKFKRFRHEKMHLTTKSYHHFQLLANPPKADAYIAGSDQIWNSFLTLGLRGAYFLDFADKSKKKLAYAPSFGKSRLISFTQNKVKKYLQDFDGVSVREKSGIDIVKDIVDADVKQLIDPTFLIKKDEWKEVTADVNISEPYILLYIMQSDKSMYDYARNLKEKLGLKVVEISRYGYNPGFIDETLVDVGPREFLGLFMNADYVCTNSYHGFIFSLIFEKRFCLIPCKRFQTRIYNLAEKLSIKIERKEADDAGDTLYDLDIVRTCIKNERNVALNWLKKYLVVENEE